MGSSSWNSYTQMHVYNNDDTKYTAKAWFSYTWTNTMIVPLFMNDDDAFRMKVVTS